MQKNEKPTVNDIFRTHAAAYLQSRRTSLHEKKIIQAISACRTAEMGGRIEKCDHCGHEVKIFNSCRNRHCPQCQSMKKEQWIADRAEEVYPYQYFHLVFTLPHELNTLVYSNRKILYKLLFDSVRNTIADMSESEKNLGARVGFFSILHTWDQRLGRHYHIHCVVPGGGYAEEKKTWVRAKENFFLSISPLRRKYTYEFLSGLKKLYAENRLYTGNALRDNAAFQQLVDSLFGKTWVVYIKETFHDEKSVIKYLARYTHSIAISNHRIVSMNDGMVTFSRRDSRNGNRKRLLTIPALEFIRRFLQHAVPQRFVRIRYYGLASHRVKARYLAECRMFYRIIPPPKQAPGSWQNIMLRITGIDVSRCGKCRIGTMCVKNALPRCVQRGPPDA